MATTSKRINLLEYEATDIISMRVCRRQLELTQAKPGEDTSCCVACVGRRGGRAQSAARDELAAWAASNFTPPTKAARPATYLLDSNRYVRK